MPDPEYIDWAHGDLRCVMNVDFQLLYLEYQNSCVDRGVFCLLLWWGVMIFILPLATCSTESIVVPMISSKRAWTMLQNQKSALDGPASPSASSEPTRVHFRNFCATLIHQGIITIDEV